MTKRVCYIHVGPHKTGTTSIQWFLQENRAELLKHGYFVPESETKRGAHHALAEKLAGMEVGEHREPLVAKSIRALGETPAETIVISSEALEGILESRKHAQVFLSRIAELNFEPKLVLFPRNQPQWINSSYSFSVKSFRRSDPFQSSARAFPQSPGARFSRWIRLADAYKLELIARPLTKQILARGVLPQFLQIIGVTSSSPFPRGEIARDEAGGLFARSSKSCMRSFWIGRLPSTRLGMTWHVVADWFQKNRSRVTSSGAFEKTWRINLEIYATNTSPPCGSCRRRRRVSSAVDS